MRYFLFNCRFKFNPEEKQKLSQNFNSNSFLNQRNPLNNITRTILLSNLRNQFRIARSFVRTPCMQQALAWERRGALVPPQFRLITLGIRGEERAERNKRRRLLGARYYCDYRRDRVGPPWQRRGGKGGRAPLRPCVGRETGVIYEV